MPDKARSVSAEFIENWLSVYSASREENLHLTDRFSRRIGAEIGVDLPPGLGGEGAEPRRRRGWLAGSGDKSVRRFARELWLQARHLGAFMRRAGRGGGTLFVISDTKRLKPWATKAGFRASLTPLEVTDGYRRFAEAIDDADELLIFSPNLFVEEGNRGITQIGYLGLVTLLLLAPVRLLAHVRRYLFSGPLRQTLRRDRLFWGVMAAAFDTLLEKTRVGDSVLLTSNSFAVEMARWRALVEPGTGRTFELMHGVPSVELLEYFDDMFARVGERDSARMIFVPPVPGLRLGQARRIGAEVDFAINSKLSEFVARTHPRDVIARLTRPRERSIYRFALNGGVSDRTAYFDSHFFKLELEIVRAVRAFAEERQLPIEIVYSMHPAHIKAGIADQFADRLDVDLVLRESVDTWLSSDLCAALVSGSIWEARYLGAEAFIAVSEVDRVFPASFLVGINHVRNNETTLAALRRALDAMVARAPIGEDVVRRRAERLFASGNGSERDSEKPEAGLGRSDMCAGSAHPAPARTGSARD